MKVTDESTAPEHVLGYLVLQNVGADRGVWEVHGWPDVVGNLAGVYDT